MKTKHTPGPWSLGRPDSQGQDAYMCEVMTAYATKSEGASIGCYDVICRTWSPREICASLRLSREECFANARLIAAAPDLLSALEDLLPMFADWHKEFPDDVGDKEGTALDAARAAIAKATGQQP